MKTDKLPLRLVEDLTNVLDQLWRAKEENKQNINYSGGDDIDTLIVSSSIALANMIPCILQKIYNLEKELEEAKDKLLFSKEEIERAKDNETNDQDPDQGCR